jgi:hypothetical protein
MKVEKPRFILCLLGNNQKDDEDEILIDPQIPNLVRFEGFFGLHKPAAVVKL